jgi:hypothetical protein
MIVGVRHVNSSVNVFKVHELGSDIAAAVAFVREEVLTAKTIFVLVPKAVWDLRLNQEAA